LAPRASPEQQGAPQLQAWAHQARMKSDAARVRMQAVSSLQVPG